MITWCLCFLEIYSANSTTLHFQCFCILSLITISHLGVEQLTLLHSWLSLISRYLRKLREAITLWSTITATIMSKPDSSQCNSHLSISSMRSMSEEAVSIFLRRGVNLSLRKGLSQGLFSIETQNNTYQNTNKTLMFP